MNESINHYVVTRIEQLLQELLKKANKLRAEAAAVPS